MLLAGAHTSELGHITAADLDPQAATVWMHGSSKYRPRTLTLDRWSMRVLSERAAHLTRPLPSPKPSPVLCTGAGGSDAHKQARVCVTVREILSRAELSDDSGVRPASLTAFAARRSSTTPAASKTPRVSSAHPRWTPPPPSSATTGMTGRARYEPQRPVP